MWRWPIVLAALTVFGLLAALIGHSDMWLLLSWGALAIPLIAILFFVFKVAR